MQLRSSSFLRLIPSFPPILLGTVDEAHCVSEWFRFRSIASSLFGFHFPMVTCQVPQLPTFVPPPRRRPEARRRASHPRPYRHCHSPYLPQHMPASASLPSYSLSHSRTSIGLRLIYLHSP